MSIHPRQSSWFDQAGFTCCASQARAFLSPGVDSRVAHGILFPVDCCVHVAVVRGLARRARPLPHAQRQDFHSVAALAARDRKSTRLNSSHSQISYAVFCLKQKTLYIAYTFSCSPSFTPVTPQTTCFSSSPFHPHVSPALSAYFITPRPVNLCLRLSFRHSS